MRHLKAGMCLDSETRAIGRFCCCRVLCAMCCVPIVECTFADLGGAAHDTPGLRDSLLLLGYTPVRRVTVQNNARFDEVREQMMQLRDSKHAIYEAAVGLAQHAVLQQTFF